MNHESKIYVFKYKAQYIVNDEEQNGKILSEGTSQQKTKMNILNWTSYFV